MTTMDSKKQFWLYCARDDKRGIQELTPEILQDPYKAFIILSGFQHAIQEYAPNALLEIAQIEKEHKLSLIETPLILQGIWYACRHQCDKSLQFLLQTPQFEFQARLNDMSREEATELYFHALEYSCYEGAKTLEKLWTQNHERPLLDFKENLFQNKNFPPHVAQFLIQHFELTYQTLGVEQYIEDIRHSFFFNSFISLLDHNTAKHEKNVLKLNIPIVEDNKALNIHKNKI